MSSQLFTESLYNTISGHPQRGLNIRGKRTLQISLGVVRASSVGSGRVWFCLHIGGSIVHSRWHSLGLSTVAARHGFWLKPGQQRSHDSPQLLCWHSHWSLKREDETLGFSDAQNQKKHIANGNIHLKWRIHHKTQSYIVLLFSCSEYWGLLWFKADFITSFFFYHPFATSQSIIRVTKISSCLLQWWCNIQTYEVIIFPQNNSLSLRS